MKLARSRAEQLIDGGERGSVPRPQLAEAIAAETNSDVTTVRGAIDACLAGGLLKGLTTRRGRKGGIVREVTEADEPEAVEAAAEPVEAAEEQTDCAEAIETAAAEAEADESPAVGCDEPPVE